MFNFNRDHIGLEGWINNLISLVMAGQEIQTNEGSEEALVNTSSFTG